MSTEELPGTGDVLDTGEAGGAAIRGGALRAAGFGAGLALTALAAPLLLRHLGVAEFGRYVVVTSLVALLTGLTEAGLGVIAQREYVVQTGPRRESVLRTLLGLRIALTVGGVAIAILFAAVAGYGGRLVLGTALAGVGAVVAAVQGLLAIPLIGRLRFGWITILDLVRAALTIALIVGLVLAGAGILPFLAVTIPTGLIALAGTLLLLRGDYPLRPSFRVGEWGPLVRQVLPVSIATALNVAYFRLSIVLVSLLLVARETGYFATSYRVLEIFLGLPALFVGAAFPIVARAARDDADRLAYAVGRIFEVAVILGVGCGLVVGLGARDLVHLVAGHGYDGAVDVLRIQSVALAGAFVSLGCGFPLVALERYRALLVANGLALAVSFVAVLVLAPLTGVRGAAVATALAELTLAVGTAFLLRRSRDDLPLPLGILPAVGVAAGVACLPLLVPGLPDAVRTLAAAVIYVGILQATHRLPPEILGAARQGLRRRCSAAA